MKEIKSEAKINFQIKAIDIIDFSLIILERPIEEIKKYNFDLNVTQKYVPENKSAFAITTVTINDSNNNKLASIKANIIFEIAEMDLYVNKKTKKVSFPTEFAVTLNSIAISTTRGIMFSQFKGTYLHNAILPLVDLQTLKNNTKIEEFDSKVQKKT